MISTWTANSSLHLIKDIEIVGEAASRVTEAARRDLPWIPWEEIVGMRNRLVHAYFDINLDILWNTTQEDLPELIVQLERVVSSNPDLLPETES